MVVALLALFIALSGGAYAALSVPRASVGTAQLKQGAVTEAKLHDEAVSARKIKSGSLLAKDFKAGQLPSGVQGPQGPQGPTGPAGPAGPATGAAGGSLAGSYPNPSIASGAVGTGQLADGAVTASKVATNSLTGAQIDSSTLGLVPEAETAETLANPAAAGIEQGEGRTLTQSGSIESGEAGASNGSEAFQIDSLRVPIVCGHEHPTVGNNAEVALDNNSGSSLKVWVNATTTNGEYSGLHTYTDASGEFVRIGLSAAPQQFVIQARSAAASYTTVLSTSYTAAPKSNASAICEWSASTTIVPG